jgi:hypothetical protein
MKVFPWNRYVFYPIGLVPMVFRVLKSLLDFDAIIRAIFNRLEQGIIISNVSEQVSGEVDLFAAGAN